MVGFVLSMMEDIPRMLDTVWLFVPSIGCAVHVSKIHASKLKLRKVKILTIPSSLIPYGTVKRIASTHIEKMYFSNC